MSYPAFVFAVFILPLSPEANEYTYGIGSGTRQLLARSEIVACRIVELSHDDPSSGLAWGRASEQKTNLWAACERG